MPDVLAWDTAPDLRVFCCCYGPEGRSDDELAMRERCVAAGSNLSLSSMFTSTTGGRPSSAM